MKDEELYRGDLVEVRSPSEILATLDEAGEFDGLPFMPEMVVYCGRLFTVGHRADKIRDTVEYTGSRRVPSAVLLEDLRCDGSAHDGCQAECRIFWKEAWLRNVAPDASALRRAGAPRASLAEHPLEGGEHPTLINAIEVRSCDLLRNHPSWGRTGSDGPVQAASTPARAATESHGGPVRSDAALVLPANAPRRLDAVHATGSR